MAFTPPTFNLVCDIYTIVSSSVKTLRLSSDCNLAMGRRINWPWLGAGSGDYFQGYTPALLLPALTDIRDQFCTPGLHGDVVEVPQGTGRWYYVSGVDDVGKGFANEYRMATLQKIRGAGPWIALGITDWPVPIP